MKIGGVILSGGKSRRMKSDKSLKKINNIPLIEIVLSKSMEQLDYIFIHAEVCTINIACDFFILCFIHMCLRNLILYMS